MPNHEVYEVAGLKVKTIGLDDLIRVKEFISRPKDMGHSCICVR